MVFMTQLEQIFQIFQQMNKNNKPSEPVSIDLKVAEKLTYHNYTTWCRMMHIEIKSRGMLDHLTTSPPSNTDSSY